MNENVHKLIKNYFTQVFSSLVIVENNAKERERKTLEWLPAPTFSKVQYIQ